jgi:membrane-bound lytic murein transglycosylase D
MAVLARRGLGGWCWGGWALRAVLFLVVMTPRVGVARDKDFPIPDGLEPAVRFWVDSFARHGRRDVLIHDRLEAGVVYDVVRDVDDDDARVERRVRAVVDWLRFVEQRAAARSIFLPAVAAVDPAARVRTHRGMRESFAQGLTAERLFRPAVRRALAGEGLPADLAALPLVESSYHPGLVSSAGAAGLWQLTAGVVERYLGPGASADARKDPARSSVVAAAYLRDLHEQFGSWPLALTAYNHGPTALERAREELGTDDLGEIVRRWDGPAFGFASKNFYASFLAARHVLARSDEYFPELRPGRMVAYKVKRGDTLSRVARRHGVTVPSIRAANGIRSAMIRPGQLLLVRL